MSKKKQEDFDDEEEEAPRQGVSRIRLILIGVLALVIVFVLLPRLGMFKSPIASTLGNGIVQNQQGSQQQAPEQPKNLGVFGSNSIPPTVQPVTGGSQPAQAQQAQGVFSDEAIHKQIEAMEKAGKTSIDGVKVIPITPPPLDKARETIAKSLNGVVVGGVTMIEVNGYYPIAGAIQYKSCVGTPLGTKIPVYPGHILICTQCAGIVNPVWGSLESTLGYQTVCPMYEGQ